VRRRYGIALALLGAAGLALYLWPAIAAPVVEWSDSQVDLAWARAGAGILSRVWTPGHTAKPGYLLFLRVALAVSGGHLRGIVILQSVLLFASICASALILARRFGPRTALVFWGLAIAFLRIRDSASSIMTEPLAAALFLPAVALSLDPPKRPRHLALFGLLHASLFLVRPNLGAAALLVSALSLAFARRWRGLVILAAAMAAAAAPFWIATAPGRSGDRTRGLTYQMFEASADDYWFPSIAPPPASGIPSQISRELATEAGAHWRRTLAGSGPDLRRQLFWRALHGLLGAEFYDARWSSRYALATSLARALSPFEMLAVIGSIVVLPWTSPNRTLIAGGLLLVLILIAQNVVLGSNPRYVLPFLPALLLLAVCAAARASPGRRLAGLLVIAAMVAVVARQRSVLGQEWGMVERAGVVLGQPIARGALPSRAPATLHIRIATPLLPTHANLEVRDSAGRLLYASDADAARQRPEVTIALPQELLDENQRGGTALRLTSNGRYDSLHYLLFPVIPPPWGRPASREGSRELSPATGMRAGSLDWWAHPGAP
jgi:hypothetical protein